MSHQFYSELWIATREDVEKILKLDQNLRETKGGKSKDKVSGQLVPMYIRYRELIRRLALCHDQVCQSQKRELIKQVLNCAIGRMLEYKRQLVLTECTESTYADDILIAMKLTPDDIGWRKPSYFVTDRQSHLEGRKKFINDLIEQKVRAEVKQNLPRVSTIVSLKTESDENLSSKSSPRLSESHDVEEDQIDPNATLPVRKETPEETAARIAHEQLNAAVLLIQSHERARKGRVVGTQLNRVSDYKKKIASGELVEVKHDKRTKVKAVITIQKWWRSYATRLHLKERINRLEAVLGMSIPSWRSHSIFDTDRENFKRRQLKQPEYLANTLRATSVENARVHRIRGPGLMEDITDEIREWFLLWYNELGFFDAYPLAEAGGSVLIATGQTRTPEEYHSEQMQKAAEAKKSKGKNGGKEKGEDGKGKSKSKRKSDTSEEPRTLKGLREANDDFLANWSLRDESGNPEQREYVDLITDKLCYELQLEMREIVDELMRLELATLEAALAKDNAEGGGPAGGQKQKDKKNKKKKKKSKGKRSKGKSKKDPASGLTIDDLFAELVTTGIIHEYPEVMITDWKGDVSYQNTEARKELRAVKRCLGDVIQPIMEYCILPIGSKEIHQIAPLVRSVSIIGLPRSGKSFLANAICSEVGALLFDLSPKIVAENYRTKKDLDRLVTVVNKVARVYPPSLLFVDAGHQPWWKKIPPEEKNNNPKRLAGPLAKLVKGIRPGDQILFLTTSDQPHKAGRKFTKIHDKFVLIPQPDYNTLYLLYKELLMQHHGVDRNFDCSTLANLSSGHSIESICEAVSQVLSIRRRITLKKHPLNPREIIQYLISTPPAPPSAAAEITAGTNEYEKLLKWELKKTPLGKRRSKMEADEKQAAESVKNTKSKKQKRIK